MLRSTTLETLSILQPQGPTSQAPASRLLAVIRAKSCPKISTRDLAEVEALQASPLVAPAAVICRSTYTLRQLAGRWAAVVVRATRMDVLQAPLGAMDLSLSYVSDNASAVSYS